MIEIGEWLPDLPALDNPGVLDAKNVLPFGKSYQSFPSLSVFSSAITARCQGAFSARDKDGNAYNFFGDASKLYQISSGTTPSDASKVGGYTTAADENWEFAQFLGNEIIATNFADTMQSYVMGTSSVFADVTGTPPKARHVGVVRDFLVVGNTFDGSDGNVPNRVRWAGIGTSTSWTVSATTQADYNDLAGDGGWVKKVVGGEIGTIFQERGIWRMTYVGSPNVFQFDKVEDNRGTLASGSVVKASNMIFYLGLDGFYIFDGQRSLPIGADKIDKTVLNELDTTYCNRITAVADPDNKLIFWAYAATGNTSGLSNKVLIYNYAPNAKTRWAYAEPGNIEVLWQSIATGYTLDGLDTVSSSIETLGFSLDSRVWTGDNRLLSAFNSDHKWANFTGTALDAQVDTRETSLTPGKRTKISRVRPVIDGSGTITVQVGERNKQNEDETFGAATSVTTSGDVPVRSNARYHRFRLNVSGGFNHIQGIDVTKSTSGGDR